MLTIVTIMLCGVATGFFLRKKNLTFISKIITLLIWILLFMLGVEVGGDKRITSSLGTLGIEAAVLTLAGVAGSAVAALALWRMVGCKEEEGQR